jgi:hypothetical protein
MTVTLLADYVLSYIPFFKLHPISSDPIQCMSGECQRLYISVFLSARDIGISE